MSTFGEVSVKAALKAATGINDPANREAFITGFLVGAGWAQFNQLTDEIKDKLRQSYNKAFGDN